MICKISFMISVVFIVGYLVYAFTVDKHSVTQQLRATLNRQQEVIYDSIVKERKWISITGYLLGLFVALIIIVDNYVNRRIRNIPINIAIATATTFIIHYFYYILVPKSQWMVPHLDHKSQREAWVKVYRKMQRSFHGGIFLGIIGVAILASAFKCK
jgi:hypothetical protein